MVDDSMAHRHHSISLKSQELDSVRKLDTPMDVDQLKKDFDKSPEDLYDSECDNKYVDSLPSEVDNHFVMAESPDQACIAEVEETDIDTEEDINVQFSANVNHSEHERSALQEHCRETDGADIKDICIDEGLPVKEKLHAEDIFKDPELIVDSNYSLKDEEFGSRNKKVDAEWPIPLGLNSTDLACEKDFNSCESEVLIHQKESENELKRLILKDFLTEKVVEIISVHNTAADDSQMTTSAGERCKNEQAMAHTDIMTESEARISSPTSEGTDQDSKIETSLVKSGPAKEVVNKSPKSTAVNNKDENIASSIDHSQLPDAVQMPRRLDPFLKASEPLTASAPLQRDHFDSSFTSAGHCSGYINYSSLIAYSGSLSHRSDASTVSTRSFAFPVLKNEWNFSPVRMQKADRRRLRRLRGWINGHFCCKV